MGSEMCIRDRERGGTVYCKTNICYEVSAHWKGLVDKKRWNKFFKQKEGKDCTMQHQFIPFHEGRITPNEKDLAAILKVRILEIKVLTVTCRLQL